MLASGILAVCLCAVRLDGADGGGIAADASFDSNNVRVGDPMTLTLAFYGRGDFSSLRPRPISGEADRSVWKIDDDSAKTETSRGSRLVKYRVRPLKAGLHEFPPLEFEYGDGAGGTAVARTRPVPVHVKKGAVVSMSGDSHEGGALPNPDGIFADLSASPWNSAAVLGEDGLFAWRKACAAPSAEAFAAFDIPEARMNEAACETLAGNWARALRIYSSLEWRTGQTSAIERGIVAALARKNSDPSQKLPVWRSALRPILRFGWKGRACALACALAFLAILAFAVRRTIRALASVAIVFAAASAFAASDPFAEIDRMFEEMHKQMNSLMAAPLGFSGAGPGGASILLNGREIEPPKIEATVKPDRTGIVVGETFNLIVEIVRPANVSINPSRLAPSRNYGFSFAGRPSNLPDVRSKDGSNVVQRISVPARYDAPFEGRAVFTVQGSYFSKESSGGGAFSFAHTVEAPFQVDSVPIWMVVKPPSEEGRPEGYAGAVGRGFSVRTVADRYSVETNDVIALTHTIDYDGFVPEGALGEELDRGDRADGRRYIVSRSYAVADGRDGIPAFSIDYYDVEAKKYAKASGRPLAIAYVPDPDDAEDASVVVDAQEAKRADGARTLRFAPSAESPAVATTSAPPASLIVTERLGAWVRVDDGSRAGWMRAEELE